MSIYTFLHTGKIKMLNTIKTWAKNLVNAYSKPQTYASALEYYIVSNNPQNEGDVDRLAREFEHKQSNFVWGRGF
jgi:hypothetical protein